MNTVKQYILVILFFLALQNLNGAVISGKVVDEKYFPVPNVQIIISGGMSGTTDANGNFSVVSNEMPYNLLILDAERVIGVLYKELNITDPELTFFGGGYSKYINTDFLKIETLPIPRGSNAILKFVSDDVFYSEDGYMSSGERNKMLSVEWPSSSKSINGKIIYIEKSPNKFEKYSERSVIITKGFYPQTVYFDSSSFYSKPVDAYITIFPSAKTAEKKEFFVFADFLSQHRNAELVLNYSAGDIISTNILVPRELSLGYRLKVSGKVYLNNGTWFETFEYGYPGTTMYLSSETPMALTGPQDKFWGVTNNTLFSYEWGSNSGIYVLHFHAFNPSGDFYIVTGERNGIKSPLGYSSGTLNGTEFSWEVSKYVPYLSTGDFAKPKKFTNDIGYKAILHSELRTFRTKP